MRKHMSRCLLCLTLSKTKIKFDTDKLSYFGRKEKNNVCIYFEYIVNCPYKYLVVKTKISKRRE